MLIRFFNTLRQEGIPVSLSELFTLLEGLQQHLAFADMEQFYTLARLCLVKDEKYFDRFDKAFSRYFNELDVLGDLLREVVPEDWLRRQLESSLTPEERALVESMGGLDKLLEELGK